MFWSTTLLGAALTVGAPASPTRIAVIVEDAGPGAPARSAIESELQGLGYEVVSPEVTQEMREILAPSALLGPRLPPGFSVFEADAIIAGAASYGAPAHVEGVQSMPSSLTARLIDLGTGRATATIQTTGVGVGMPGPALALRSTKQAVSALFGDARLASALQAVGQQAGMVTMIVQGLPSREALLELRAGLERVFAGAPVREVYFARNLGKLVLGGSTARSMVGPDIADAIAESRALPLHVEEVANTRIVASYDRARSATPIHALVLEPRVPRGVDLGPEQLGKYMATRIATFEFARASYQSGRLSRDEARARAKAIGADVIVESELLGSGKEAALSIRVIDVKTGKPILRQQRLVERDQGMRVAEALLESMRTDLPSRVDPSSTRPASEPTEAITEAKR